MVDAVEFFAQLGEFSNRVFSSLGITNFTSPWATDTFPENKPTGVVLHYTGSHDAYSSARWFMRPELNSKVSAHVIIGTDWPPQVRERHAHDLALVRDLPTMVLQCVPFNLIARHATWVNGRSVGLELVNWGEIRFTQELGWVVYPSNWTKPYQPRGADHPRRALGRYWEPYPAAQVHCAVEMLRWYRRRMQGRMRAEWVLGHEQVQGAATGGAAGDKRDPGPLLPLQDIREEAFRDDPVEQMDWFQKFAGDPFYTTKRHDELLLDWYLAQPGVVAGDRAPVEAQQRFTTEVYELGATQSWQKVFGALGKTCLRMLGYCIPHPSNPMLEPEDVEAVRIFQRLVGIRGDGRPGYVTRHEVCSRMVDRGFI